MTITGAILRNAVIYAAQMITSHRQEIDALNVFPVPDGDTGTNMSMTITNASREVRVKDDSESVSAVASCVASGLLRGARGNSGVILSLIFRGISKGLKGLDEADGAAIASALEHGSSSAYKAVMKPTEGTILTVIRTASEYARKAVNAEGCAIRIPNFPIVAHFQLVVLVRGRESLVVGDCAIGILRLKYCRIYQNNSFKQKEMKRNYG